MPENLKAQLVQLERVLEILFPGGLEPDTSTRDHFKFAALHMCLYNRFHENVSNLSVPFLLYLLGRIQGPEEGETSAQHPSEFRREGKTRVNHGQRMPHLSEDARKDMDAYRMIIQVLKDVLEWVASAVSNTLHILNAMKSSKYHIVEVPSS